MVKQTITRNQIIYLVSMFALLVAANYFDIWQDWLKENVFELKYMYLRLWLVPVATLVFGGCWLVMFQFMLKQKSKTIATLFLVIGICILFYPAVIMSLRILSVVRIHVGYFGDSMLFHSSALVAAMGLIGPTKPLSHPGDDCMDAGGRAKQDARAEVLGERG